MSDTERAEGGASDEQANEPAGQLIGQAVLDELAVKVALRTPGVLRAVASTNRRLRPGANAPSDGLSVALDLTVRYGEPVQELSSALRNAISSELNAVHGKPLADCDLNITKFIVDGEGWTDDE